MFEAVDYVCAGVELYCAPTADARGTWQASMLHIALEGGCFVLSANQFCRRRDYPPAPEYVYSGFGESEPGPDEVVCAGGSVIISPTGTILAGPNFDGEALITADLGKQSSLKTILSCKQFLNDHSILRVVCFSVTDMSDVVRAKFDFDVVGHYSRPDVLSLTVRDQANSPVTFTSELLSPSGRKPMIEMF